MQLMLILAVAIQDRLRVGVIPTYSRKMLMLASGMR